MIGFLSHHTVAWRDTYSLLCVILFVILFLCMVTDFSVAEKVRGVKFCVRVGLLSGQVFSRFAGQGHPSCVRMVCTRCKHQEVGTD